MKHKLFKLALRGLRMLARIKQIGNPAGKAPTLISTPDDKKKIYQLPGEINNIFIWRLLNVTCSGLYGGVIIDRHNKVHSRFLSFPWSNELHPTLILPYLGRKILTCDKAILLITPVPSTNYYHWIIDVLPRLLIISKYRLIDFDERCLILHHSQRVYENETLESLGIQINKVIRIKPFEIIQVGDIITTDFVLSFSGHIFPAWKKSLLDDFKHQIIDHSSDKPSGKIYLLRGKQRTRRLIGEQQLIFLLQKKGFLILDPQKMTLKEQGNALASAHIVVAPHGAALTNIIFCSEQTLILEIRSTHKPPEYFSEIAKTYNLRFDTFSVPPKKIKNLPHIANEQNLILTKQLIERLINKLSKY